MNEKIYESLFESSRDSSCMRNCDWEVFTNKRNAEMYEQLNWLALQLLTLQDAIQPDKKLPVHYDRRHSQRRGLLVYMPPISLSREFDHTVQTDNTDRSHGRNMDWSARANYIRGTDRSAIMLNDADVLLVPPDPVCFRFFVVVIWYGVSNGASVSLSILNSDSIRFRDVVCASRWVQTEGWPLYRSPIVEKLTFWVSYELYDTILKRAETRSVFNGAF
jgi:hypothetical protein